MEAIEWKDMQCIAQANCGVATTPTCKHTTRKDFFYFSPQLQQYVTAASNCFDRFPDHSILTAIIEIPTSLPVEAYWYKPDKIIFQEDDIKEMQCKKVRLPKGGIPAETYHQIFQKYEAVVLVQDFQSQLKHPKWTHKEVGLIRLIRLIA